MTYRPAVALPQVFRLVRSLAYEESERFQLVRSFPARDPHQLGKLEKLAVILAADPTLRFDQRMSDSVPSQTELVVVHVIERVVPVARREDAIKTTH
jgi:hypothetical protein